MFRHLFFISGLKAELVLWLSQLFFQRLQCCHFSPYQIMQLDPCVTFVVQLMHS